MCLRRPGPVQSGQGLSDPVGLCRAGPYSCSWRPAAPSPSATLLMSKVTHEDQVVEFVRAARETRSPFEIMAGGTRRSVGRPLGDLPMLDVSGLSRIVKYEPAELIITAQPATPLTEIKAVLAEKGQRLGFDPADWSRLLGSNGAATLAGAASSDASGSGKLRHGGARDSLLGFRAVNRLGE